MKQQVKSGQNLLDVTLKHTGSIEAIFEIAVINGISVTDNVEGSTLELGDVNNKSIVNTYTSENIAPATDADKGTVFSEVFSESLR